MSEPNLIDDKLTGSERQLNVAYQCFIDLMVG